jgi:hypothetical protein
MHEAGVVSRVPRDSRHAQAWEMDRNTDQTSSTHQHRAGKQDERKDGGGDQIVIEERGDGRGADGAKRRGAARLSVSRTHTNRRSLEADAIDLCSCAAARLLVPASADCVCALASMRAADHGG